MRKILPIFMIVLILSACTKDTTNPVVKPDFGKEIAESMLKNDPVTPPIPDEFCNQGLVFDLVGEQTNGLISVNNDEENLYVTFNSNADEGWFLYRTGLYVGTLEDIPLDEGGEPDPFKFNVITQGYEGITSYTYVISLIDLDDCFIISAIAKVNQLDEKGEISEKETIWTKDYLFGDIFPKDEWGGGYVEYCLQECKPPSCYGEETAWSFGNTFTSLTGTKRWGWYSEYTIGQANEYTIFAGQHNDIGTLYVSDDGTTLTVSYQTDGGAVLGLAHLYVGTEMGLWDVINKKGTPVPGKFEYKMKSDPYTNNMTFNIPLNEIDFDGTNLVLAAHAESYLPVDCEEE